jgi:hypothetical protein
VHLQRTAQTPAGPCPTSTPHTHTHTGLPKQKIEECAARQQARIDSGSQVIVGVNKFVNNHTNSGSGSGSHEVELRHIDNSAVLEAQLARLARLKQSRDGAAVAAALQVGCVGGVCMCLSDSERGTGALAATRATCRSNMHMCHVHHPPGAGGSGQG